MTKVFITMTRHATPNPGKPRNPRNPNPRNILLHRCQQPTQLPGHKAAECDCNERIDFIRARTLIEHGKADWLIKLRNGKPEQCRTSAVLRFANSANTRISADKVNGLSGVVNTTNPTGKLDPPADPPKTPYIIRANGERIPVDSPEYYQATQTDATYTYVRLDGEAIIINAESTDEHYWNSVLASMQLSVDAGEYLNSPDPSQRQLHKLPDLENWTISPEKINPEVDRKVEKTRLRSIKEEANKVCNRREHRVHATGHGLDSDDTPDEAFFEQSFFDVTAGYGSTKAQQMMDEEQQNAVEEQDDSETLIR